LRSINPTTGAVLAEYAPAFADEVDSALAQTHATFLAWRWTSLKHRTQLARSLAGLLRERSEALASLCTQEMGKPLREARGEVAKCAWLCEHYADVAVAVLAPEDIPTDGDSSGVRYDPLGVVLGIMPWNFPFWQAIRFAVPAITAGNACLLKHAPNTWGVAQALETLFVDAGYPRGLMRHLPIEVALVESVISDPRVAAVTLTGSERAGRAVAAQAGRAIKPSVLELGGSDPFIVLADADLEEAARVAVISRFLNAGQSCVGAKRMLVESSVHDRFVALLTDGIAALRLGDPREEATDVGPLARNDLRENLHRQIEDTVAEGAALVLGGVMPDGPGFFYPPTLLTGVRAEMTAFCEETFGPLACVARVEDAEEAIRVANASPYGLGGTLFSTRGRGAALAPRLEVGHVSVNGLVKSDPRLPFGGVKLSGYGRELGPWGLRAFVNVKTLWVG
jgi:succinate-semialdehyde dehydrogenase / glutarate-semialdehyde dehydrogenase